MTVDPTVEVPSEAGDCKLDEELAGESFCGVGRLEVGWGEYGSFAHDHRSILKFDVQAALPPGAQVTDAALHAYLAFRETGTQDKTVEVHRVTSPWTDDATWLNRAAGVAWTNPGGDFAAPVEAQVSAGQEDTWYSWPVTSLVSGWQDGGIPNQGLLLKDDGTHTDGSMVFASTESDPDVWPYLEVAYTGGAPDGPELALSGGLRTPLSTDRDLTAQASDDGGVASVAVWLDPDLDPTDDEKASAGAGCTTTCTTNFTLPTALAEGRHTILVKAVDGAGGVTRERWQFFVAPLGADDRSRLGLEQWFQYDATDAGGNSNVYVNADTGNVVWHSVPIVDPGRGLSTVVNLTYNSQDHGGLLGSALGHLPVYGAGTSALNADRLAALSYSEAGNGFSISVSGPTRINEPLRGVIAAAAAEEATPAAADGMKIAMTDGDGTEHEFTNVAGQWVAPPGLNMRLRRYKDGGTIADPIPDKWALTRPDGVTHFFDNLGFLTSTEDRNHNTLTYQYASVNAFTGVACAATDAIGVLVTEPSPRLCVRRLTEVVDPAGHSLQIEYRDGGFMDLPVEGMLPQLPADNVSTIGGVGGRISRITDHAGRESRFQYDDNGYLTRLVEAANKADKRVTDFHYEAPTAGLRGVGDDRLLDTVRDMRDQDDDGQVDPWDIHASTELSYEDRPVLPAGSDRAERRPQQLTKRSGGTKHFAWEDDPARLEVSELLDEPSNHSATTTHEVDERGRPTRVTDALGTVTALEWSEDNKVTRFTRAQGTADESATDYSYDTINGTGVLESQTEYPNWPSTAGARTTDLDWSFGPGLFQSTPAGDATGHFVADLDSMENPKPGTGWDFTVDEHGNVTDREDAKGNVAHTTYDTHGQITLERDELEHEVTYSDFDPTGQPGTVVDERVKTWTYKYDAVGNVTAVVDPRATDRSGAEGKPYTTTLGYDSFDRLTREHIPKLSGGQTPVFITRTRAFDRNGNVIESVDGRGERTAIAYTGMDLPAQVSAPGSTGSEITRYAYDTGDRLIGTIAPKGDGLASPADVISSQAQDCAGSDPPLAYLTRYCLDDIGRVQAQVRYSTRAGDPNALLTSYAYDRRDNLVGTIDPNRNADRVAGDAIDAAADPAQQRMSYAYDKVDEQTTSTERPTEAGASPTVWQYVYDPNGNRIEIRHPRGDQIRTDLSYDHRDQLVSVEDPLGHLTCLQRRADERVVAMTTPRGTESAHVNCTNGTGYTHFTTRYAYDEAGNLTERSIPFAPSQYGRTDAELAAWKVQYARDDVGDPVTITDARGNAFANTFYDMGELRSTNRPSFFEVRGGTVAERPGRSANAERSDDARTPDSTLGQTDFGTVDPEPLRGLLPQAGHTELTYDGEMNLTAVTDANEKTQQLTYDPAGRLATRVWPFKSGTDIEHAFAYDKNGNLTSFTDGEGDITSYVYDGYDRLVEQTAPGAHPSDIDAAALSEVTRFRYDLNGNQRFRETPRGVATAADGDYTFETAFDSLDRVRFEQAPDGGRTSHGYDVASNVISETRPRGQDLTGEDLESFQTRMTYDDADRLTESRQQVSDGGDLVELVTTLGYDADDNLTSISGPGAKSAPGDSTISPQVTTRVFDGRGLSWKITRGSGGSARTALIEHDANGNLRRIVNPRGVDSSGNALSIDEGQDSNTNLAAASQNATVFRYDADDLVIRRRMPWDDTGAQDSRKFRTVFQRNDPLSRVTSILSAHEVTDEGQVDDNKVARTSYTYFDNDWVASISDQKLTDPSSDLILQSRLVDYDYDKRGAQIDWRTKHAAESAAGRHIARTFWPNGQLKTRTAAKRTNDADDPVDTRSYRYFYNRNESLVGMQDVQKNRLTSITRDPVERQLDVNETWSAGKDTRYAYDLAGNVTSRKSDGKVQPDDSFAGTDAKISTFSYDSLDRETQLTVDPATGPDRATTTSYWPSGQRESRVKPNGTTERWFFNTRGQVSHFDRQRDGQSGFARETDYSYDANANRDQDERGSYRFNPRDQLVRWAKPNDGQVTEYDLNGDGAMTAKRVFSSPDDTTPRTTMFAYRGERLRWAETDDVRAFYRYDDLGNVVRIRQRAKVNGVFPEVDDSAPQASGCGEVPADVANDETYYCYDEFERPALAKGAGIDDPEVIGYDGLDRRDTRRLVGNVTRDFSYLGTSELLSREVDDDGAKRFYDYDSTGDRLGQQVTTSAASRYRAYTKDANNSVLGLEDDQGDVVADARYDYDPYGELENESALSDEAQDNPFRFEGFYYDSGVKTYDMLARPYRPDVGRFLTQDRYAAASADLLLEADPLTQNRYAFAGAHPVNVIEFDGHVASVPGGGAEQGVVYDKKPGTGSSRSLGSKENYVRYPETALSSPSAPTPSPRVRRAVWEGYTLGLGTNIKTGFIDPICHQRANAYCTTQPYRPAPFAATADDCLRGGYADTLGNQLAHAPDNTAASTCKWASRAIALAGIAKVGISALRNGVPYVVRRVRAAVTAKAGDGNDTTRVGRWMSREEHEAMERTGRVQEGGGGVTSVARPANPRAYERQAARDSRYVEFDVPTSALRPGGRPDWAVIPGPNSIFHRLTGRYPEMPRATCIEWRACRR